MTRTRIVLIATYRPQLLPVEYNVGEAVSWLVPLTGTEVFVLQAAERNTVETRWSTQQVG